MTEKKLPYDIHDKESIVTYAVSLKGTTLREHIDLEEIPDITKNKGSLGSAIEQGFFQLDVNTASEADFTEVGMELKTTPLKRLKNGELSSKERLVIGMINYEKVVHETFESSHFLDKAKDILLISYIQDPEIESPLDYPICLVEELEFAQLPDADQRQIKNDWETVVDKVRAGLAHELSGSDTLYLEACTKSSSSKTRRPQPYSDIPAKPRAWALKPSYMTALSRNLLEQSEPIARGEREKDLQLMELIQRRFEPYFGKTEEELGLSFGLLYYNDTGNLAGRSKDLCARITKSILGIHTDKEIDEFVKAGIKPKTMRLRTNGTPTEDISFKTFDYTKVLTTPFEESEFYEQLQQKYLFVIYRATGEANDQGKPIFILSDLKLWQMPEDDLDEAKRCYKTMQERIRTGHADANISKKLNRCCHVRPHGRTKEDKVELPDGGLATKRSFWLNAGYIKGELGNS